MKSVKNLVMCVCKLYNTSFICGPPYCNVAGYSHDLLSVTKMHCE